MRSDAQGALLGLCRGELTSRAPNFAFIDADMQHDKTLLPKMLKALQNEGLDIVIDSCHVAGGGIGLEQATLALQRDCHRYRLNHYLYRPQRPDERLFHDAPRFFERNVHSLNGKGF